jgi:cytochrome c oxidase assembly protein Cox11
MPVFFYVDPDILDDPKLDDVSEMVLSYSFFLSKGRNAMLELNQGKQPSISLDGTPSKD